MSRPKAFKYLDDESSTSITSAGANLDRAAYNRTIRRLERFKFWRGSKPILGLWQGQQSAVALGIAYMHADRALLREGNVTEAALIKMPTGTGKSGVIAILCRCVPEVKRALVLTPRAALTGQLLDDIASRFWGNIGFEVVEDSVWSADANTAGAPIDAAEVLHLLPATAADILKALTEGRAPRTVLVGTLQALDTIRREVDAYMRRQRRGEPTRESDHQVLDVFKPLLKVLATFDLVVVDEGHYEPAPSWSRTVRQLDRPTLLFSATPFRNDYKLFRLRGRFVFNLGIQEAWERRTVRRVEFAGAGTARTPSSGVTARRRGASESDTEEERAVTREDRDDLTLFVDQLHTAARDLLKRASTYTATPKIIVRAASFEILELLQIEIEKAFGERPVLIHQRVLKDHPPTRQFGSVRAAQKIPGGAQFWLHETKLLEGIDNPDFVAVAIYEPFSNVRQLVQQIGRILRSTDKSRKTIQRGTVIIGGGLLGRVKSSWERYLDFEIYCRKNVSRLVQNEAALPDRLLEYMPDLQYIDGDFRRKYLSDGAVQVEDIRLPLRASVFLLDEAFDRDQAELEIEEAILAEDRFMPRKIEGLPDDMSGWTYYGWRNTPYLVRQYLAEWTLGVCLAAQVGPFLFVQDTGRIVFNPERLEIEKADRQTLLKSFPDGMEGSDVVLTRMSSHSLDMSDRAIRTQAVRTRSFATTFTDLLDPQLVPTSIYGFVDGKGRYLGIARSRISDASDEYVGIAQFHEWVTRLSADLANTSRKPHTVFDRYARPVAVGPADAEPASILLDLTSETFREFNVKGEDDPGTDLGHDMPYDDLCADVTDGEFQIMMRDGRALSCKIEFRPERRRYRLISKDLDGEHPPLLREGARRSRTLTAQINREQTFRILTKAPGVVYAQGGFYATRDLVTPEGLVLPLEDAVAVPALTNTISEKGENFFTRKAKWQSELIFGVMKAVCEGTSEAAFGKLGGTLDEFELLLLDDGGDEIGDFLALDRRSKRVALIHAKASADIHRDGVTGLQAVGRQAIACLAFCSTQARVAGIRPGRWNRPVVANKKRLNLSRIFKAPGDLDKNAIDGIVTAGLSNPSWNKEVWIVAGRLLDVEYVRRQAVAKELSNHARQLLMYLESLRTACGRANARLRIFAH